MKFEVKIPAVGESVNSAVIGEWQKNSGDFVQKDEVIALLEPDKASVKLPAEAAGLLEITKQKGEELPIGSVIALIDTSAELGVEKNGQYQDVTKNIDLMSIF